MASARFLRCTVLESKWLTPTVVSVRFEPHRAFHFDPGQFLSVMIPVPGQSEPARRAYSFCSTVNPALGEPSYELCIKVIRGGLGSSYMAALRPGDVFEATAPYGDFLFEPRRDRYACFISTGTGIAPFRSMILSTLFHENPPRGTVSIFGAQSESEIIYPGEFQSLGVHEIHAITRPETPSFAGFHGRVTDFVQSMGGEWAWRKTDYYLCGNGRMVAEVRALLENARGVDPKAIRQEIYFEGSRITQVAAGQIVKPVKDKKGAA